VCARDCPPACLSIRHTTGTFLSVVGKIAGPKSIAISEDDLGNLASSPNFSCAGLGRADMRLPGRVLGIVKAVHNIMTQTQEPHYVCLWSFQFVPLQLSACSCPPAAAPLQLAACSCPLAQKHTCLTERCLVVHIWPQLPNQARCYSLTFPEDPSRNEFYWWV